MHVLNESRLIDKAIEDIQKSLTEHVGWLDNVFGRAQRITKKKNEKTYIFPACFNGGLEYEDVSPCEELGNFSFFVINDPVRILDWDNFSKMEVGFGLIVWFDMRKIPNVNHFERNTEQIKDELLKVLSQKTRFRNGTFRIDRIFERAENIYREFPAINELSNQFLMHPFCAFRFEGILIIEQLC